LEAIQSRKSKSILGNKSCMMKVIARKKRQHTCMQGIPNDVRVRVFAAYSNGLISKNI
jgi:hypothetical protein